MVQYRKQDNIGLVFIRRFICSLCLFLIGLSFGPIQLVPVKAVDKVWMEVIPRRIGMKADYRFHFSMEKKLERKQWIAFRFPPGTTMNPPIPLDEPARTERINTLVNSISIGLQGGTHSLEILSDGSILLKLQIHISLDPVVLGSKDMQVTIPADAGFTNPSQPGEYIYKVATEAEPKFMESELFSFVESQIKTASVSVDPPIFNQPASYKIDFVVGDGGNLAKHRGYINLSFPNDTKLTKVPSEIKKEWITVNNIPLLVSPEGSNKLLKIVTPVDIRDGGKVTVKIDQMAGIVNPSKPGSYRLLISSSTDLLWAKSEEYTIFEKTPEKKKTLSITNLEIDPVIAHAKATYKIGLQFGDGKLLSTGDRIRIQFSFLDEMVEMDVTSQLPQEYNLLIENVINPNPGTYSIQVATTKEPKFIDRYRFTILPKEFETILHYDDGTVGRNNWYIDPPAISFVCSDPTATVFYWWDDKADQIQKFQYPIRLAPGEYVSVIHFYAKSEYQEEEPKAETIKVDTIKPSLLIINPQSNPLQNPIQFHLKSDPGSFIRIDGSETPVKEDGSFICHVPATQIGPACTLFEAVDPAGNVGSKLVCYWFGVKIFLQIGNTTAMVNEVTKTLPLPPMMDHGSTLVPFRFIGEQLQAKIDFTIDPKTGNVKTVSYQLNNKSIILTIGSRIALINNQKVSLEVPPQIFKGTTFIPLRFVSEALGCRVQWEAAYKRITIEYPLLGN